MARDEIRTRWHDWVQCYRDGNLLIPSGNGTLEIHRLVKGYDQEAMDSVADGLTTLPHYFISKECMQFVDSDALTTSINALQRAGLESLPNKYCVVEFDRENEGGERSSRFIVVVSARDYPIMPQEHCYHPYLCRVFMIYTPNYKGSTATRVQGSTAVARKVDRPDPNLPKMWAVAPRSTYMIRCIPRGFVDVTGKPVAEDGFHFMSIPAPWVKDDRRIKESRFEDDMRQAAGTAVRCLLGLMRTRGVVQEAVSAPKLNRARVSQGKPSIPDHTVVRLGFYVDRDGARRSYDPASRVPQVMHYRSAHTKRVWYGPRGSQQSREQFIEGYVVNYVDGAEKPGPRPKVVRAPKLASGGAGL